MNKFLVTIIIPVYNAETKIERCLDSVVNQEYSRLEIILINDGSSDNSEQICCAYQRKDDRIRYFSQPNGGVSSARNLGLKKMTGDYVVFIDADDYVLPDFVSSLIKYMDDDIDIICTLPRVYNEKRKEYSPIDGDKTEVLCAVTDAEYSKQMVHERCSVISNAYKKDVVDNLKFSTDLYVGEDMLFHLQAIKKSKYIIYSYLYKYVYIQYIESAFHGEFSAKKFSEIYAYQKMIAEYEKYPLITRELSRRYYIVLLRILRNIVLSHSSNYELYFNTLMKEIRRNWAHILFSKIKAKDKLIWIIIMINPEIYRFLNCLTER